MSDPTQSLRSKQTQLFVEQLTIIDSAWFDENRGLVGDSWIIDVELDGFLNDEGMLLDFGDLKPLLKKHIDERFDHKLLLTEAQTGGLTQDHNGINLTLRGHDRLEYQLECPAVAIEILPGDTVSATFLALAIKAACIDLLPSNVNQLSIKVYKEETTAARYHYCHGLRQHLGNCQRIAHGHRARLEIYRNSTRCLHTEHDWVSNWQDIFIGSANDIQADTEDGRLAFAYTAPQGYFRLELPEERCIVLENQTTAECIANHIADTLHRNEPTADWAVRVFEGVHKGAGAKRPKI